MQTYTIDTPEGYVEMPANSEEHARHRVAQLSRQAQQDAQGLYTRLTVKLDDDGTHWNVIETFYDDTGDAVDAHFLASFGSGKEANAHVGYLQSL